jgi:hypothetical protein
MTPTESSKPKVRTVTLTGKPPVRVREDLWPVIASARRHDGQVECQANHLWHLTVRQHEDGRTLVYGSETSGPGGAYRGYEEARAGELLDAGADVASAIIRVGTDARCSQAMQDECIGDLPPVDLDARPARPASRGPSDAEPLGDFWGSVERMAGVAVSKEKLATLLALLVQARPHCPADLQQEIV